MMTFTLLTWQYINICRNISISLVLELLLMWLKPPQTFLSMYDLLLFYKFFSFFL